MLCPPCAEPATEDDLFTIPLPPGCVVLKDDVWVRATIVASRATGEIVRVDVTNGAPADAPRPRFFCIPGLIDTHVHLTACTADLAALTRLPTTYVTLAAGAELRRTLSRGFTTVRDAGGADGGLALAAREGVLGGLAPRVLFTGHALSQTGGHGDMRGPGEEFACGCCAAAALRGIGRVADGVDACRAACRDELRKGAHAIKIMAGGGVASPSDALEDLQFSDEEIAACVDEAARRRRCVVAGPPRGASARARAVAGGGSFARFSCFVCSRAVVRSLAFRVSFAPVLWFIRSPPAVVRFPACAGSFARLLWFVRSPAGRASTAAL